MPTTVSIECCICCNWKDPDSKTWFTPTPEQRRIHHFQLRRKFSHHYCPLCVIMNLKNEGITSGEIIDIVNSTPK
jgi:hypothetical protein